MIYRDCRSFNTRRLAEGLTIAVCLIFLLTACSTTSAQRAQWARDAAQPLTCSKGTDCENKWNRALNWVRENADADIQHADENLITTNIPLQSSSALISVTKDRQDSETYLINFRAGCSALLGCEPTILQLRASFANYVMRSIDSTPPGGSVKPKTDKDILRRKAQLGVVTIKLDQSNAIRLGMTEVKGTRITYMSPGAAFDSGLRVDDVILKFAQQPINDDQELDAVLERTAIPAKISVTIWRSGEGEMVIPVQF